jgi:ferrous iron transport protein A
VSKRLSEIPSGGNARIRGIEGGLNIRQRLCELGVYPGESVLVEKTGILGGPLMLKVGDHHIAIGKGLAQKILVE